MKRAQTDHVDAALTVVIAERDAICKRLAVLAPAGSCDRLMLRLVAVTEEIGLLQFTRGEIIRDTFYRTGAK